MQKSVLVLSVLMFFQAGTYGQDISLFEQFNGRYDYFAFGNTMNTVENGPGNICAILSSSSASLELLPNQNIISAYLYWAGSGLGDFNVTLNDIDVFAERTFSDSLDASRVFFAAFTDVTNIVLSEGNGLYTLSNLDISDVISPYCPTGTNFAGWAIAVIYEDENLPLNQLNVYDGLQSVPTELLIELDNLNVLDNDNAKIGFIAWEGDSALAVNEQLSINGNTIQNPPLNPANNAFNGTNSFSGATDLYNMDIDFYNIQNNINIGDTSATIQLTSGQDFVMINNVITVLNSQLPDATIVLDDYFVECGNRIVEFEYTVFNNNSTDPLPANTPIAFYANDVLIGQASTNNVLDINASEIGSISLNIPNDIPEEFILTINVDDNGLQDGIVTEISETNNSFQEVITLIPLPETFDLIPLLNCDIGYNTATFDLNEILNQIENEDYNSFAFYNSHEDLLEDANQIIVLYNYESFQTPQTIFVKAETSVCYDIFQFDLLTENCPPYIPQGFSPNDDGFNDYFNIQGLYTIFENHELLIYNRYGTLIFIGDDTSKWYGIANQGINKGHSVPTGTYFYVLKLNDENYQTLTGWVYLNK